MGETDDEVDEFAEAVGWFGDLDGSWPEASSPPASWCSWEPSLMGSLVGDFSLLGCVCSSSVSIGVPVYQSVKFLRISKFRDCFVQIASTCYVYGTYVRWMTRERCGAARTKMRVRKRKGAELTEWGRSSAPCSARQQ